MTVLSFPSRHLSCQMPANVRRPHQDGLYDGFSGKNNAKADHSFWRPVVGRQLVDVASYPDAAPADIFERQGTGDEDVCNSNRFDDWGVDPHEFSSLTPRQGI